MRPFRVFNDVKNVRIIWKLAGVRLGPVAQIATLLLIATVVGVVGLAGPIAGAVLFGVGFVIVTGYAVTLSRLDETEKISELTQLRLLRRGLRHRHTANFDLTGL